MEAFRADPLTPDWYEKSSPRLGDPGFKRRSEDARLRKRFSAICLASSKECAETRVFPKFPFTVEFVKGYPNGEADAGAVNRFCSSFVIGPTLISSFKRMDRIEIWIPSISARKIPSALGCQTGSFWGGESDAPNNAGSFEILCGRMVLGVMLHNAANV